MRKLLLASAAVIGATGVASAQTAPAPMMSNTLSMPTSAPAYMGGNNSMNSDGSVLPKSPNAPTPGSMTIHLNGRVWFYAGFGGGSGWNFNGNKLAPMQYIGYMRLYPGVDALATNGLRYGAIVEIRQNFIGQGYGSTSAGLNGAGANYSTSPSGASCASTLYARREAVYLGSDQIGIFRLGQDDGPFSQFDGGTTTFQFGTGAWNGDGPDNIPGNGQPTFPFWSGIGAEYTVSKAVYFSPQFYGFDIAASFAPNNGPNDASTCSVAAAGCLANTTTTTNAFGNAGRPTNWYEIMARYQGNFSGLGVLAIAGYSGSGTTHSTVAGTAQFNGFSVGDFGLALSYAGFTVGGNVLFGQYNGQVALLQKAGNGLNGGKNAIAWVGGILYTNGPWTAGASYYNYQYAGSNVGNFSGQRYDDAFAATLDYGLAPGLTMYAEYLYSQSHQGGVNILAGTASNVGNEVHVQSLILGTRVQW